MLSTKKLEYLLPFLSELSFLEKEEEERLEALLEAMRIIVLHFLPLTETFHHIKYTSLKTKRDY